MSTPKETSQLIQNLFNEFINEKPLGEKELAIAIWGGELGLTSSNQNLELKSFLEAWDFSSMPYRIWEYSYEIKFEDKTLPSDENYKFLERGRVFGEGGDLKLRRDGYTIKWNFIGKKGSQNLNFISDDNDFWHLAENKEIKLRKHPESVLLWGEYSEDAGRWIDDRVGWAKLCYPVDTTNRKDGDRVVLKYTAFTQAGQTMFVWFQKVEVK